MASKYKAPENPYDQFRSDIARELTSKHFAFKCGHKTDKKVYRTLAYVLGHRDDCPIFEHCNGESAWIWKYHGSGEGLDIIAEGDDSLIYQGPTWTVKKFESKNGFKKEGVTRAELADVIIEGLKETFPDEDYEAYFDELLVEADKEIKESEANIQQREKWLSGEEDPGYTLDDWSRKNFQKQINSWTKYIKELKEAMEVPALPPIEGTKETKYKKIYLISARSTYDDRKAYFVTTAFSKKEADRQINKHNGWVTRRASTGLKQEPYYKIDTARVEYEFENEAEYKSFLEQNPRIEGSIVSNWQN